MIKAKQITYKGMKFRSKLEARYFNHFTNLGWDFDYEPEVPGLMGYQPDFVIYPSKERDERFEEYKPIYVEIKPVREVKDYYVDPEYKNFREKIKRCWNPKNDLILFGGALKSKWGCAATALCLENKIYDHITSYCFTYSYQRFELGAPVGLQLMSMYEYVLEEDTDPLFWDYRMDNPLKSEYEKILNKIEISWNKAHSDLRWEPTS
tara:strand:- start:879 stop:1499 length:621 start_codon:yes stop_codon:yes gene_type:complete